MGFKTIFKRSLWVSGSIALIVVTVLLIIYGDFTTRQGPTVIQECGGVVHVPSGSHVNITYKNGSEYDLNEHCLWIVSSKQGSVEVKFLAQDFQFEDSNVTRIEEGFTFVQTVSGGPEVKCSKWSNKDYLQPRRITTPFLMLFTSHDTSRKGFVIQLSSAEADETTTQADIDFVGSRKRGSLSLLRKVESSLTPVFVAFQTSPKYGISRRNLTCTGNSDGGCCEKIVGYEIKAYHEGSLCIQATGLNDVGSAVISNESFVLMFTPDKLDNYSECRLDWNEGA